MAGNEEGGESRESDHAKLLIGHQSLEWVFDFLIVEDVDC